MNRVIESLRLPLLRRTALSAGLALALGASVTAVAAPSRVLDPAAAGRSVGERLAAYKAAFAQQRAHRLHVPAARHDRPATTVTVTNCDDDGPGSLREAFVQAVSGDAIDLTQLDCSLITLTSGALASAADDLTLDGPGQDRLAIDGNASDRIIVHAGAGTLSVAGLTLQRGTYVYDQYPIYGGQANGACILSSGTITITDSAITQCSATGVSELGGAIHADGPLVLTESSVTGTTAIATTDLISSTVYGGAINGPVVYLFSSTVRDTTVSSHTTRPFGGLLGAGVFGEYGVEMIGSTVTGSHADVSAQRSAFARGGGVGTAAAVIIQNSTISDNSVVGTAGYGLYNGWTYQSAIGGGGLYIVTGPQTNVSTSISNSTISGNVAECSEPAPCAYTTGGGGGLANLARLPASIVSSTISGNSTGVGNGGGVQLAHYAAMTFSNSTITDNSAPDGAGIAENSDESPTGTGITADSSIVAGNHLTGDGGSEIAATHAIAGSHDLIASADVDLPPDTIAADPLLGPLADNGGPTRTHALLPGSPAIDAGDNDAGLDTDQRGDGYPRVAGAAADIGAFEAQAAADDTIFADGFD